MVTVVIQAGSFVDKPVRFLSSWAIPVHVYRRTIFGTTVPAKQLMLGFDVLGGALCSNFYVIL